MFKSLLEKCKIFAKSASSIKLITNDTDPFFEQLSKLSSFEERVELAKEKFKFLGEGSARTVFEIDKDLILKVAHNKAGIAQNLNEMRPEAQKICADPVIVADAEGKWIVMRQATTITKKRFKELTGFGFDQFMTTLYYKFNNESDDWSPPRDYEKIVKSQLFICLADMAFDIDAQLGDWDKISSWGELDGKAVIRDNGLSRDIMSAIYEDDSSSSSSSKSPPKSSE